MRDGPDAHRGSSPDSVADSATDLLSNKRPLTLAHAYMAHKKLCAEEHGVSKLWHWRGDFYAFGGAAYSKQVDEIFESEVDSFLNSLSIRQRTREADGKFIEHVTPLWVTTNTVRETINQLRRLCQARVEQMPAWLGRLRQRATLPDPREVIAFQNGLLFADEFVAEEDPSLVTIHHEPTPLWFSETVLPCNFEPRAMCPRWLAFLDQSLGSPDGEDVGRGRELIEQLQEWFGYCLTGDTRQQKMLWLHGRSGAGKSTLTKLLKKVVGEQNSVSFKLPDLIKQFTFHGWLGKRLAVSEDASLGRDHDSNEIIEQIKAITGEDDRSVDRKFRDVLPSVRLSVRFVITTNQFPQLPDASDALRRRSLIIPFDRTFEGEEDRYLVDRLSNEIAGITWWAMQGLRRLRRRGHFQKTQAGDAMQDRFTMLNNPIRVFAEECLEIADPADALDGQPIRCLKKDVYDAYRYWCRENGNKARSAGSFGEALLATVPAARSARVRDESGDGDRQGRVRVYEGIRLSTQAEQQLEEHRRGEVNAVKEVESRLW